MVAKKEPCDHDLNGDPCVKRAGHRPPHATSDGDKWWTNKKPMAKVTGKCPNCPHPLLGIHNKRTGKCKMCKCQGPNAKVKGGYASDIARQTVRREMKEFVDDHFAVGHVGIDFGHSDSYPVSVRVNRDGLHVEWGDERRDAGTFGDMGKMLSEEAKKLANKKRRKP